MRVADAMLCVHDVVLGKKSLNEAVCGCSRRAPYRE